MTYVYTKAPNRGSAAVMIDGIARPNLALRSATVEWQKQTVYAGLGEGRHEIEIRVVDGYVDIDALLAR